MLLRDVASIITHDPFWYRFSFDCLVIGILSALLAATFGFIDYFRVKMSTAGHRLATTHMILNLTAVILYIVDCWLRRNNHALGTALWTSAAAVGIVALIVLGSSGWIGGKMAFEHKIGVVENADPEATEIGKREVV